MKNEKDPAGNPVYMVDKFHSQFKLNYDGYLDNNNFIRHNKVITSDDRVNFLAPEKSYAFVESFA